MSELQVGLIGLGVIGVLAVVVYNTWVEYRQRKQARALLAESHADVLLGGDSAPAGPAPVEPSTAAQPITPPATQPLPFVGSTTADPAFADERREPVLRFEPDDAGASPAEAVREAPAPVEPASPPEAAPQPETTAHRPPPPRPVDDVEAQYLLSPVIDYVAVLDAPEAADPETILSGGEASLRRVRKPVHWIGYNEKSGEWESVIDDGASRYRRVRVGLQLVDRHGALGEAELLVFQRAMQELADALGTVAELPPMGPALEAAAELDRFCASVDIQIGINVVSTGQPFPGTKLRALAEAAGMAIEDGRFVRRDDEGCVLYVLTNQEAAPFAGEAMRTLNTHGVTFLLDVPRVAHGERVFAQMVDLARRFAETLRGALVDDNRQPLSEGALEPIRRQVGQVQGLLVARRLPPGGPLAQRLFS